MTSILDVQGTVMGWGAWSAELGKDAFQTYA